ncbi:MAG: cadmium-translocating P-type ATPase [Promicromonosporaceae bacterium]|nr:cadmium-translocating P-type ATPase [Promicromonosporaceae bacterium]
MFPVFAFARRYPFVLATLLVALIGGVLTPTTTGVARWVIGGYCALVAARSLYQMIRELLGGKLGLDILAITAIAATLAVGQYWASIVIVLMLTGGEALEEYAANRAKRDLTSLVSNAPREAYVLALPDGSPVGQDMPVEDVPIGSRVLVRASEVVPLDGTLVSAAGMFDDSSLTGESLPVERVAGDEIYSGSINGASAVELVSIHSSADSQYQQIVALVESAANSRAPMVRMADRYAVPFTLVSLAIAGLAWWLTGDPYRFAQVLVVATPCPLIIAAPVSFMAGTSRAARRGVIIRSSGSLEQLHKASSFAFDKTGTLTRGTPELVAAHGIDALTDDELLRLSASAEQGSAHILAKAIQAGAAARGLTLTPPCEVTEETGGGVQAQVEGRRIVVGKESYVAAAVGAFAAPALEPGELAVHVGVDGAYAGSLVLRDQLREEAAATIASLRTQGIETLAMFTGDAEPTARHIAEQIGITEVHAGCLPADKVRGVQELPNRPVVMVGDGVNDAPVLAAADVGIAMAARGSTAASETADIVILPDSFERVAETLAIGRRTVTVARQSIWIGIGLSLALMLFATTGVMPAVIGAWVQEAVDVVCILWALRAGSGALKGFVASSRKPVPARA